MAVTIHIFARADSLAFRHAYLDLSKTVAFHNTSMLRKRKSSVPVKIMALCCKTAVSCLDKIVVLSLLFYVRS